ncbi:MAG: cell division protein FtsA, partial [Pseudobutyrivibrio sp.]|nr:cell division protein FtsA [Pseudobutyrivibrio sp.]
RYEILVNNRPSGYDSLVYENFVIDWTTTSPVAYAGDYIVDDEEGLPEDYQAPPMEDAPVKDARTKIKIETVDLPVKINGKNMVLSGKKDYIFVDIYNLIDFDPNAGNGRPLVIRINGEKCGYADELHANDEVECYWE